MAIETRRLIQNLDGQLQRLGDTNVKIAVVIPCYRERAHILDVLASIPQGIYTVIVVDDACPDGTGRLVEADCTDSRVHVVFNNRNEGVGGASKRGFVAAMEAGADIIVKLDGDGQMDPQLITTLTAPIAEGHADYTKGNRFFSVENTVAMPKHRIVGNIVMSFVSKFSTGYWHVFDPNNGYVAIHREVLNLLPLQKISDDYFFEPDMLFRLNTLRAVVVDIPMRAKYGTEQSHLVISRALPIFVAKHTSNFFKRIFYSYFLRGFSVASIQWLLGPALFLFGTVFGIYQWHAASAAGVSATAGTVMLAALPIIIGLQLILAAIDFDVKNVPAVPLHRLVARRFEGGGNDPSAD